MPQLRPASSSEATIWRLISSRDFEGLVELHLADLAAQRGLRELRDRGDVVRRAVGREPRIGHLVVEDAVDAELGVVLGDADLLGHVERHFLQRMHVGDAVEERDDEVEPGSSMPWKLPEALDHPRALLRHDAHALDDEGHDHADEQDPEPVTRRAPGNDARDCRRPIAIASFQNMVILPLGDTAAAQAGRVLGDFERVAIGGEHVDRRSRARIRASTPSTRASQLAPR